MNRQRGFALIIIAMIVAAALAAGGIWYYFAHKTVIPAPPPLFLATSTNPNISSIIGAVGTSTTAPVINNACIGHTTLIQNIYPYATYCPLSAAEITQRLSSFFEQNSVHTTHLNYNPFYRPYPSANPANFPIHQCLSSNDLNDLSDCPNFYMETGGSFFSNASTVIKLNVDQFGYINEYSVMPDATTTGRATNFSQADTATWKRFLEKNAALFGIDDINNLQFATVTFAGEESLRVSQPALYPHFIVYPSETSTRSLDSGYVHLNVDEYPWIDIGLSDSQYGQSVSINGHFWPHQKLPQTPSLTKEDIEGKLGNLTTTFYASDMPSYLCEPHPDAPNYQLPSACAHPTEHTGDVRGFYHWDYLGASLVQEYPNAPLQLRLVWDAKFGIPLNTDYVFDAITGQDLSNFYNR